ncbi:MAG: ECF transporter S component [Bifidobacterium tsurumiense]|uniref:ECF transporter S component n=2 Tax=Bifidobacterium tsurumiense TaxID=356829 RepID=UPI002A82ED81|nr:ECF transporter S component [Bifidobacterium tsurumiense]MDY4677380.1 ECF transporter S component [Bifidobacterium tsurumiense]
MHTFRDNSFGNAHAYRTSFERVIVMAATQPLNMEENVFSSWLNSIRRSMHWRTVDIATASLIAVASGLVFWIVDFLIPAPYALLSAVVPGLGGTLNGFWYIGGVIAMLIVRKPGAAIYAETLGAALELLLGNQWGAGGSLVTGIIQGAFTEIVFLIAAYRIWNIWIAMIAGASTAVGGFVYTAVTEYIGMPVDGLYLAAYFTANLVSGIVISGALMWWLFTTIAKTGILEQFESGRSLMQEE